MVRMEISDTLCMTSSVTARGHHIITRPWHLAKKKKNCPFWISKGTVKSGYPVNRLSGREWTVLWVHYSV